MSFSSLEAGDTSDLFAIADCSAYGRLLSAAVFSADYEPPDGSGDFVALTASGEAKADELAEGFSLTIDAIRIGLLGAITFDSGFVNPVSSNLSALRDIFHRALRRRELHIAWDYGTIMDARILDLFGGYREAQLTEEEARSLLQDTPQGVWQMGHLLFGPLGILPSRSRRRIFPPRAVGSLPCTDPSCTAIHSIHLPFVTNPIQAVIRLAPSSVSARPHLQNAVASLHGQMKMRTTTISTRLSYL